MRIILLFLALLLSASRCGDAQDSDIGLTAGKTEAIFTIEPVFPERDHNEPLKLMFTASGSGEPLRLQSIDVTFTADSEAGALDALSAWYTGVVPGVPVKILFSSAEAPSVHTKLPGNLPIGEGKHTFVLD